MNLFSFIDEVKTELKKVTWPKRQEVINYLGLVLAITVFFAVFVGTIDYSLTKILEYLVTR